MSVSTGSRARSSDQDQAMDCRLTVAATCQSLAGVEILPMSIRSSLPPEIRLKDTLVLVANNDAIFSFAPLLPNPSTVSSPEKGHSAML